MPDSDRTLRILSSLSVLESSGMCDSEIADALGLCSAGRVSEYRRGVHAPTEGTVRYAEAFAAVIVRSRRSRCAIAKWWPDGGAELLRLPNKYDAARKVWRGVSNVVEGPWN